MTHIPVLLNEVLAMLSPQNGCVYFDGTFGGGGYSRAILESADCKVIACDRDPCVQGIANDFLKKYPGRFSFFHAKFSEIRSIVNENVGDKIDGIVLDLGVSTFQLSDPSRGFSFKLSGPLDMSMGLCDETALDVIRKYSEKDLADIIYKFGEERFSRRIARNVKLNIDKIKSSSDLADIVRKCVKKTWKIDPATKTFQAIRIFVNDELGELEKALANSVELLKPGGKIIVVTFHSLEDRIVKLFFRELASKDRGKFTLLNKKPIVSSDDEISANPKARSAKLRGIVNSIAISNVSNRP
jgi:16S rRNA (cytosine1402-N4)-methyltransferase